MQHTQTHTAMNWTTLKHQIEAEMDAVGITHKIDRTLILNFERRVNTCKNNYLSGQSLETMRSSKPYAQAAQFLSEIKSDYDLWYHYSRLIGEDQEAILSDFI